MKLTREDTARIIEQMKNEVVRPECWTCDCFQGLLTQLELDCAQDITDLTTPIKAPKEKMHGCLGCDPCPGGAMFAQYLRSNTNNDTNNTNIQEIPMETEKKKKGVMATIWESMTKTGGCCGGGGNCCGPSNEDDTKTNQKKSSNDEEKRD